METESPALKSIRQYQMLLEMGEILASEMNLESLFPVIADQLNGILNTERCSVFLYDNSRDELWSLVSTDLRKGEIRISSSEGAAGWVFQNCKPLIIDDAYSDKRFCPEIDRKTGFQTRNILCIPLVNRQKSTIGTLQALNKIDGDFTEADVDLSFSASRYIVIALENARLYEQMDLMLKARERIINHLSHELKTPLAIITGSLEGIRRKIGAECAGELEKTIQRAVRNVDRLVDLQRKIDDILNNREAGDRLTITRMIESAADMVEGLSEEHRGSAKQGLERIAARLAEMYQLREMRPENIALPPFLDRICDRAQSLMGNREIRIDRDYDRPISLIADPGILSLSCEGFLRNAIENTPDEGRIRVSTYQEEGLVSIRIHDFGVGITAENQKLIFTGFFHTQQTDAYSSKVPYAFNAGGAGIDLFRIRTFAERIGFDVDFESRRCCFLPTDSDTCPGRISACPFINSPMECFRSGFSMFALQFKSNPVLRDKKPSREEPGDETRTDGR